MYRIVIADDEVIACRAMEMMIRSNFPDLEILPSTYNGTDLIASTEKYKPDIAIVDVNMPRMGGLEALEIIRTRNHQIKIIVCSVHNDFNYVRKAMSLGASDYILKPFDKAELVEILRKAITSLQTERRLQLERDSLELRMKEMHRIVGNEFLSSLMLGEPDVESFQIYLNSLGREYHGGILMAAKRQDAAQIPDCGGNLYLLHVMEEEIRKFCSCVGKLHKDEMYFLIFPESYVTEQNIHKWIGDIVDMLRILVKKQGIILNFGISSWKFECNEMEVGLAECKIAVRSQGKTEVCFYESPKKQMKGRPFAELSDKCLELVKKGEIDRCCAEIHEAFQKIELQDGGLEDWQIAVLEFTMPIFDYMEAKEDDLRRYSKEGRVHLNQLNECGDLKSLERWVIDHLRRFSEREEKRDKKCREYIERAIIYMEKHYMEDISLGEAAEISGVSSFYLSRLLKQELNQTFVEILTDIRMRNALRMLWEGRHSVKEIAEQTGYSNITYFYKVFKKYTGINIGEMRDYLRQNHKKRTALPAKAHEKTVPAGNVGQNKT